MKRYCILSVYNDKGIIHPYLIYYINDLKKVIDKLFVIVNGHLKMESVQILKKFTDKIFIRENSGYDVGSYQEALDKYLLEEELQECDELVLSNDTCFGPFIPFEEIYRKMEPCNCDFWGITYSNTNNLWPHLQSYFLTFRKATINEAVTYIKKNIDKKLMYKQDVIYQFEFGLFQHLDKLGFRFGYYSGETKLGIHEWPYQQIKEGNCPFLKIGSFERYDVISDNILAAIQYIKENYSYDIGLITEMVCDKYHLDPSFVTEPYDYIKIQKRKKYLMSCTSPPGIRKFFISHSHIYIYGLGSYAEYIFWYYHEHLSNLEGFIVSSKKENENQWMHYPIFTLSEIPRKDIAIMVAMTKEHTDEVREKLKDYNYVFYLWH